MKLLIENFSFPTFGHGTPRTLSQLTCVPRHTGWDALP